MLKSMTGSDKKTKKIYLDYASSIDPNPSSIHREGVEAKNQLENARTEVAEVLRAQPREIIFTSGGTESNNIAIQGIVFAWKGKGLPHIITTNIEHPSVLFTFKLMEKRKLAQISIVPVEENGIVDPKKIKKEIKKNTVLVSVMYANNEIGTIQPIREIAKEIRHFRKQKAEGKNFLPFFHTDAVQAANYLDLSVERLGVDLLSLSGSKIEGSGRVGALYKKNETPLERVFGGGDQEMGLRPGTENLPEILKFSHALKSTQKIKEKEAERLIKIRNYFLNKIVENFQIILNGDLENRLPNNINITIPKIPSDLLVIELSAKGIMASAKSACKSLDAQASHVIEAIRQGKKGGNDSLRLTLGRGTSKKDIDAAILALSRILTKLKKWYS